MKKTFAAVTTAASLALGTPSNAQTQENQVNCVEILGGLEEKVQAYTKMEAPMAKDTMALAEHFRTARIEIETYLDHSNKCVPQIAAERMEEVADTLAKASVDKIIDQLEAN